MLQVTEEFLQPPQGVDSPSVALESGQTSE